MGRADSVGGRNDGAPAKMRVSSLEGEDVGLRVLGNDFTTDDVVDATGLKGSKHESKNLKIYKAWNKYDKIEKNLWTRFDVDFDSEPNGTILTNLKNLCR